MRADSGNFAAALGLLIGLARADGFGTASSFPVARANFQVPGILHQYWDKDPPPQDVQSLMARAKKMNPYFSYRRWTDVGARQFLSTISQPDVRRAYKAAKHVAMRADIFRLAVLFEEGGIYLDADDYCAAPLRALLPPDAELVCYQDEFGSIGNNFLAAVPRHPIVGAALHEAARAVLEGATEALWLVTGPGLMSRVVASAIARTPNLRPPAGLAVLPLQIFHGIVHPHRRVSYKLDRRHWIRAA
jgi:mannosyltransferase OCH1-like enzyme